MPRASSIRKAVQVITRMNITLNKVLASVIQSGRTDNNTLAARKTPTTGRTKPKGLTRASAAMSSALVWVFAARAASRLLTMALITARRMNPATMKPKDSNNCPMVQGPAWAAKIELRFSTSLSS